MTSLSEIRSVADAYLWKLHAVGIDSVETLYARCSTAEGCERVAAATGIDRGHLDQWMHHADLLRLGLSDRDAELLEAAGVLTSLALAHRDAHVLRHRLRQVNERHRSRVERKHLKRELPSEAEVAAWIDAAKHLPPAPAG